MMLAVLQGAVRHGIPSVTGGVSEYLCPAPGWICGVPLTGRALPAAIHLGRPDGEVVFSPCTKQGGKTFSHPCASSVSRTAEVSPAAFGAAEWRRSAEPIAQCHRTRARSLYEGYGAATACPAPVLAVVISWSLVPVSVLERLHHLQRDPATV